MSVDMTITIGNIIAGCVAFGSVAVGWGTLRSDLKAHRKEVDDVREASRERHTELAAKVNGQEHRLRNVEQGHTAIATKIEGMAEMLREVRDAVLRRSP